MREVRYWPGYSDMNKLGMYKAINERATSGTMQSNLESQRNLKKPKRFRSAFTTEQINYLEKQYRKFPYINRDHRKELAACLKLEERPIKIWFQNRRMKEKKDGYKECDYDANNSSHQQTFGEDPLNNMSTVPSTNDQRSYSLPVLSLAMDATAQSYSVSKKTINEEYKENPTAMQEVLDKKIAAEPIAVPPKPNYYKEVQNIEHVSPYFKDKFAKKATPPFLINARNKISSSQRNVSAEFSINLCKKYKKDSVASEPSVYDTNANEKSKTETLESVEPNKATNCGNSHDITMKKPKLSCPPPPEPPKQININNPAYYHAMPTICTPPFMSAGGVLWKPVNVVPVMATNTSPVPIPNPQGTKVHEQSQNCMCNCHGSTQHVPVTFPPSFQNPYAQYVIPLPYQLTSPRF